MNTITGSIILINDDPYLRDVHRAPVGTHGTIVQVANAGDPDRELLQVRLSTSRDPVWLKPCEVEYKAPLSLSVNFDDLCNADMRITDYGIEAIAGNVTIPRQPTAPVFM